jgi:hypothetical protein
MHCSVLAQWINSKLLCSLFVGVLIVAFLHPRPEKQTTKLYSNREAVCEDYGVSRQHGEPVSWISPDQPCLKLPLF